jgi:hypothetical protein
MFKALAKWTMDKPLNAIIAIVATLFIPLLFWLGAALMALSILRHGAKEAANVVLWGSLPAFVWLAMGIYIPLFVVIGTIALAVTLRSSVSLMLSMLCGSVIGIFVYLGLMLAMPETLVEGISQSELILVEIFKDNPEAWQQIEPHFATSVVGALSASLTTTIVLCLLLARWWQSLLYNPGGYREEFLSLKAHSIYSGSVFLLMILGSSLPPIFSGLLSALSIPLVITAASLAHSIIERKQLDKSWLTAFYISVFLLGNFLFPLLIFIAFLDSIIDIRGRLKDTVD